MTTPLLHREKSNSYRGEIVRHGRHHVVLCYHCIQWILQRQNGGPDADWQSVAYCVTRKALLTLWTASAGVTAPELANLPEQAGFTLNG